MTKPSLCPLKTNRSLNGARTWRRSAQLGIDVYPRTFERRHTVVAAGCRARRAHARRAGGRAARDGHGRTDPGRPLVRQGEFPRHLRRPGEDSGLHPPGFAAGARLSDLQAARFRRLDWRRRAAVPDEDQRADDLGVAAALPVQVPAAAARKMARAHRRRDPLPPALPRPHRQPRLAAGVRDAQPRRSPRSGSS